VKGVKGEPLSTVMNKVSKVIKIINLLHHRRYLTAKDIAKACNVSVRTAYRYIETISAANVPVYYDKSAGGYRMHKHGAFRIDNLGTDDAILISLGLKLLSRKTNANYRRQIDSLLQRVNWHERPAIKELWQALDTRIEHEVGSDDLSNLITTLIVNLAILCERNLEIHRGEPSGDKDKIRIQNPSLYFDKEWQILSGRSDSIHAIPLSAIKEANVI
jgi:predicted DNA-binding transcriptional regulator YafY